MSLLMAAQVDSEGEQVELRGLQTQLETTQTLVALLSQQLSELKEQVCLCHYNHHSHTILLKSLYIYFTGSF